MSVKAIYQSSQEVGRNIKSSKKKYIWKFSIDDKDHTLELFVSTLSGKKKVVHNGRVLRDESNLMGGFNFSFSISSNILTIQSSGDSFDLRINSLQFSHLYHNEKTKKEFQFEDGYKESRTDEYPKKVVTKGKKPLYNQDEESGGYDLGIADGFEQLAPQSKNYEEPSDFNSIKNPNARLNIRMGQPSRPQQQQQSGFDSYQNQFSKPPAQQPPKNDPPPKNQFDFGNFGNPAPQNTTQSDNAFSNFGNFNFGFDQPQQQQAQVPKPQAQSQNPFDNPPPQPEYQMQQPPPQQQQVVQQPPPKPPQNTNLIDFMDDLPDTKPIQATSQQSQPQQQKLKEIPKDLLDVFDSPPQVAQQSQVNPPPITSLYQQPYQGQGQQNMGIQQQNMPQQQNIYGQPQQYQNPQQQQHQMYQQQQQQPQQQYYQGQQGQYQQQQQFGYQQQYQQQNVPVQVNVQPKSQATPFDDLF